MCYAANLSETVLSRKLMQIIYAEPKPVKNESASEIGTNSSTETTMFYLHFVHASIDVTAIVDSARL